MSSFVARAKEGNLAEVKRLTKENADVNFQDAMIVSTGCVVYTLLFDRMVVTDATIAVQCASESGVQQG